MSKLEELFKYFHGGICVPRIQRGYVQGRTDEKGNEIQKNFAPALVAAVFGESTLSLDFIYGVASKETGDAEKRKLLLLDGQQRLSTLFLLAWLCGQWKSEWIFTYESRRIPQLFVKGLQKHQYEAEGKPSTEIEKSGWFLPIWKNDPSIAGMLRMLDALHESIGERKRGDADFGKISFLLHGIDGDDDTFDHIFRKMNARGKALSRWENMKAMLDKYVPENLKEDWRNKVDGDWAQIIWKHTKEITKLDSAMEKIIRMAYARSVQVDAQQNDSLWEMEKKLKDDARFYQIASTYFSSLEYIFQCWTDKRENNELWDDRPNKSDNSFWNWLFDDKPASFSDLLRIAFLAESKHDGDGNDHRRRRILLNLLDASSINKGNFAKALETGLRFLAGEIDLNDVNGYSKEQLKDEIRKLVINENEIVLFEKDELVCKGSLLFIGGEPFRNADDIRERLELIRTAVKGDKWLDFYQNLVSLIPPEKFDNRYIYAPRSSEDITVWREHILTDERFINALKWNTEPRPCYSHAWMEHLRELLNANQVVNSTLRCRDGWMFLLQNESNRSSKSIRLDKNENEREHRQLLRYGQIYYTAPWPWAEAKESGVLYNVCDPSWGGNNEPPKGRRDANGDVYFVDLQSGTV